MSSGRFATIGLIVSLAVATTGIRGGPERPMRPRGMRIDSYEVYHSATRFEGRENAQAIVHGMATTGYLGLYIFDAQGNCTAMDDLGDYQTRSDLAVEWYVLKSEIYQIDVVNFSDKVAEFVWVFR